MRDSSTNEANSKWINGCVLDGGFSRKSLSAESLSLRCPKNHDNIKPAMIARKSDKWERLMINSPGWNGKLSNICSPLTMSSFGSNAAIGDMKGSRDAMVGLELSEWMMNLVYNSIEWTESNKMDKYNTCLLFLIRIHPISHQCHIP